MKRFHVPRCRLREAREQLGQIANVCGTPMYRADRLSDLDGVYEQVVRDLSTVYSIGYSPTNKSLDGKWRSVEVHVDQTVRSFCPHQTRLLREIRS